MTNKTTEKTPQQTANVRQQEELQAAYQCHTLAQILYGHIAMTCPWVVQAPTPGAVQPTAGMSATPWTQAWSGIESQPKGGMGV